MNPPETIEFEIKRKIFHVGNGLRLLYTIRRGWLNAARLGISAFLVLAALAILTAC